jgi:secretion/DNA translocation related TadE-like protein
MTASAGAGGHVTAAADGRGRATPAPGNRAERQERGDRPGELGGASLVALALTAFLLLAGLLAVDVGALAGAKAAAQTAADMAALAALTPGGDPATANAAVIASANGAELVACDCSAVQAVVTVRRRVALVPTGLSVRVTARARAVLAARPEPRCAPMAASAPAVPGSDQRARRARGAAGEVGVSGSGEGGLTSSSLR